MASAVGSGAAVPFWRAAGMTYISYSNICANLVRNCLKEPLKSEAASREKVHFSVSKWVDGTPQKPDVYIEDDAFSLDVLLGFIIYVIGPCDWLSSVQTHLKKTEVKEVCLVDLAFPKARQSLFLPLNRLGGVFYQVLIPQDKHSETFVYASGFG